MLLGLLLSLASPVYIALTSNLNSFTGQTTSPQVSPLPRWLAPHWPAPTVHILMPGQDGLFTLSGIRCASHTQSGEYYELVLWSYQFGWPLRSASWSLIAYVLPSSGISEPLISQHKYYVANAGTHTGYAYGTQPPAGAGSPRRIPLTPIWTGLLANTALFTLTLFLPVRLFALIRWLRRPPAHICTTCGYDSTGFPRCPECGNTVAHPSSPSPTP